MLSQRIGFGALMIAALFGLIWLDDYLAQRVGDDLTPRLLINLGLYLREGLVITLLVTVVMAFSTLELGRLLRGRGYEPAIGVATLANVGLILLPWFVRNGLNASISNDLATDYQYTVGWLALATMATMLVVMARRRTAGAIGAIACTLLAIIYLGLLPAYLVRVRMWGNSAWLVLYVLFVCKVSDIGAYFTGMAFGRHKLIEWLSPKKTWEGLIGGLTAAALLAIGLARLGRAVGPPSVRDALPDLHDAALFGLAMGLVGQFGDLVESMMKRDAALKDSGAVVPSFGGLLDIVDSPVITAPVAFWLLVK